MFVSVRESKWIKNISVDVLAIAESVLFWERSKLVCRFYFIKSFTFCRKALLCTLNLYYDV